MKKEFKSITKKIIENLFITICITIILFAFIAFILFQLNNAFKNEILISKLDNSVIYIEDLQSQYLLFNSNSLSNNSEDFDILIEPLQENLKSLTNKINTLYSKNSLNRNSKFDSLSIQYINNIDAYRNSLLTFHFLTKEKGNDFFGFINQWKDLSNQINEYFETQNNAQYSEIFRQIKSLERNYILYKNQNNILEIINYSKDIIANIDTLIPGNAQIQKTISKYVQVSEDLSSVDQQIGMNSENGAFKELNHSYIQLDSIHIDFSDLFLKKIKTSKTIYFLILSLLSFIIILFYAVFFYNRFNKIAKHPLKKIHQYLSDMSLGIIYEVSVNYTQNDEIKAIFEKLKTIENGLKSKIQFTKSLNSDMLNEKLELLSKDDALGEELLKLNEYLKKSIEDRKIRDQESEKRRYINEGLAKFAEIIHRSDNDIKKLTDIFIKELVRYTKSIQGGVFLLNDYDKDNIFLELSSAFAYNRKKYLSKQILIGEGLLGSCAKERKTINLTEIPNDYIEITSGLGDAPPNNILIVPMIKEDSLIGVVEIASFNKYLDYEIDFIKQASGNLAGTILSAKISEQTSKLLSQSRLQAQQMAEQEEEMRQNMEELQATQEESMRREEEFYGFILAIENSFMYAEFSLEGIILKANEKYLSFLGLSNEEILGKGYKDMISLGSTEIINEEFWTNIRNGDIQNFVDYCRIGKKKLYNLNQYFIPVYNKNEVPVKIINIAFEVTSIT